MTANKLEQYTYLVAKIKRLRKEMESLKGDWAVCGSVQSSNESEPYTLREIIIGGCTPSQDNSILILEKRSELECAIYDKAEIEQFINAATPLSMKEILTYKYIYGEKLKEVAAHFGYKETEDSIRMKIKRYLKSCSECSQCSETA